ncbi:hypothetical protein ACOALA_08435 [Alicyclobacillus acidoterrestris]|uniref:hypothetical protein n=1 Tax=Alicyclobacillus acidoterrestris TaxID=1450 RepID=UPI003F53C208
MENEVCKLVVRMLQEASKELSERKEITAEDIGISDIELVSLVASIESAEYVKVRDAETVNQLPFPIKVCGRYVELKPRGLNYYLK